MLVLDRYVAFWVFQRLNLKIASGSKMPQASPKTHFYTAFSIQLVWKYVITDVFSATEFLKVWPKEEKLLLTGLQHAKRASVTQWRDLGVYALRFKLHIEQLKHICQIEHSRHRSPTNFVVNLLSGLIAYCHRDRKPSIAIERFALPA